MDGGREGGSLLLFTTCANVTNVVSISLLYTLFLSITPSPPYASFGSFLCVSLFLRQDTANFNPWRRLIHVIMQAIDIVDFDLSQDVRLLLIREHRLLVAYFVLALGK